MTSPHGAVAKPEYGVESHAGLSVVALRNVADQAQYFALLIDGNRIVSPGSEIEPTDLGALERSDRRDRCRADGLIVGKGADSRKSLFVLIQNQNESPSVVFGSQFGLHDPPRGKDVGSLATGLIQPDQRSATPPVPAGAAICCQAGVRACSRRKPSAAGSRGPHPMPKA